MKKPTRTRSLLTGVLLSAALAIAGVAAYAQTGEGNTLSAGPLAKVRSVPPGPHRLARAHRIDPATAKRVFKLRNGQTDSVASSNASRCLIQTGPKGPSETCGSLADLADGEAIAVTDECGSAGSNLMEITGLAPEGAATVRLMRSNDTHVDTPVEDGAFRFEGTNPEPGQPYPDGILWLGPGETEVGTATFPVRGDEFCIDPPNPPTGR